MTDMAGRGARERRGTRNTSMAAGLAAASRAPHRSTRPATPQLQSKSSVDTKVVLALALPPAGPFRKSFGANIVLTTK